MPIPPLKSTHNRNQTFQELKEYALRHKKEAVTLNKQAKLYANGERTTTKRDELFMGSLWIPISVTFGLCRATNYWEIALDQFQNGSYALLKALDRYNPAEDKQYIGYATKYVQGAILDIYSDYLSVVQHKRRQPRREPDINIENTTLPPDAQIPSILDQWVELETHELLMNLIDSQDVINERIFKLRTSNPDTRFIADIGRQVGLTPEESESAWNQLCPRFNAHSCQTNREQRHLLHPQNGRKFTHTRLRKGLSMEQVIHELDVEFSKQGIHLIPRSIYTILHLQTENKNQSSIDQKAVMALEAVYSRYPDINFIPEDVSFIKCREKILKGKWTQNDFIGRMRMTGITDTRERIKATYDNLIKNKGVLPYPIAEIILEKLNDITHISIQHPTP